MNECFIYASWFLLRQNISKYTRKLDGKLLVLASGIILLFSVSFSINYNFATITNKPLAVLKDYGE